MSKVLLVEDDHSIADMISIYLSEENYHVSCAFDGKQAQDLFTEERPDVVILDLMLPDTNGIELCKHFRTLSNVPIMIVSAKNEVSERVNALTVGADDYLCKPFSMRELAARTSALLRRAAFNQAVKATAAEPPAPEEKDITLDLEKRCIYLRSQPIDTTYSEFEIMRNFWLHPGKVFSREELLNKIRGIDSFVTERSVDVHITNLRKKVETDPKDPKYIKTVWGVGYKFELK
ncbi:response regulator transcription factor [Paenibacillus mucilaginosus]|uniref:Winged helix family two component transcriptional regulator n=3 Tax=Paenibacillus mucilaginosus TaxID=61624 RepID=H6NFI0_9BACL|nr:response regulator transcription factor [Paenibacillus mucilaginosus]AEI41529.1 two component transcriptional regulator, winged helix family [Paenibacillus mucilaginosus KNP414]AFC30066.1 winged helix family two component transcriptional regulator [Paenibacillus mucilaginosus 3016]MCG7215431.1 response regulator transcription factor [Paenibacillus mucilaginosus]WDM30537.1 response regulator transcription factor [Paenibacillus mucilaginosus]WFA18718.1 response regulator transcription factor 